MNGAMLLRILLIFNILFVSNLIVKLKAIFLRIIQNLGLSLF